MTTKQKSRWVPNGMVRYEPTLGDYKNDLFEVYVSLENKSAIFYKGKQSLPLFYCKFATIDAMKEKINKTIGSIMSWEDRKAERKAERSKPHTLQVNDILYTSWGYEQTNIDFYQVTKRVGSTMVELRPIASRVERHDVSSEYVVPVMDAFTDTAMKKRVSGNDTIAITSYATAWKWDGKPKYRTALGWGH